MQNKRIIFVVGILIIVVGAAAFTAGKMLTQKVGPLGFFGLPMGGGGMMSISVQLTPAPELPTTKADVTGLFVSRQDNTVTVQSVSMEMGKGGVVVSGSSGGDGPITSGSSADANNGPKVEVVITAETKIYRDTTQVGEPSTGNANQIVQQTVEESTLDNLNSQSMVTVWGRKNGDRIIADVLFYSNPVMFKRP
jgi:hypothetical protein